MYIIYLLSLLRFYLNYSLQTLSHPLKCNIYKIICLLSFYKEFFCSFCPAVFTID